MLSLAPKTRRSHVILVVSLGAAVGVAMMPNFLNGGGDDEVACALRRAGFARSFDGCHGRPVRTTHADHRGRAHAADHRRAALFVPEVRAVGSTQVCHACGGPFSNGVNLHVCQAAAMAAPAIAAEDAVAAEDGEAYVVMADAARASQQQPWYDGVTRAYKRLRRVLGGTCHLA